jgi:hypothetical protein
MFNFHADVGFLYSSRILNDDGWGHVSCFVVVCNVEQNWELEEICSELVKRQDDERSPSDGRTYVARIMTRRRTSDERVLDILVSLKHQRINLEFLSCHTSIFACLNSGIRFSIDNEKTECTACLIYTGDERY